MAGTTLTTNQGFKALIPGTDIDSSFLLMVGRTLQREMVRRASRHQLSWKSQKANSNVLKSISHRCDEQQRIAEILDAIDETIRSNEEQRDKLQRVRSGLAAELLSGRIRTVARD